jgi:hypothetical protein
MPRLPLGAAAGGNAGGGAGGGATEASQGFGLNQDALPLSVVESTCGISLAQHLCQVPGPARDEAEARESNHK